MTSAAHLVDRHPSSLRSQYQHTPYTLLPNTAGHLWLLNIFNALALRCELLRRSFKGGAENGRIINADQAAAPDASSLVSRLDLDDSAEVSTNEWGVYEVMLYREGSWHAVTIDDRLPVDVHMQPLFCQPYIRAYPAEGISRAHGDLCSPDFSPVCSGRYMVPIWSMLLEKALAKLLGGYSAVLSVAETDPSSLLLMLTGGVIRLHSLVDQRDSEHSHVSALTGIINDHDPQSSALGAPIAASAGDPPAVRAFGAYRNPRDGFASAGRVDRSSPRAAQSENDYPSHRASAILSDFLNQATETSWSDNAKIPPQSIELRNTQAGTASIVRLEAPGSCGSSSVLETLVTDSVTPPALSLSEWCRNADAAPSQLAQPFAVTTWDRLVCSDDLFFGRVDTLPNGGGEGAAVHVLQFICTDSSEFTRRHFVRLQVWSTGAGTCGSLYECSQRYELVMQSAHMYAACTLRRYCRVECLRRAIPCSHEFVILGCASSTELRLCLGTQPSVLRAMGTLLPPQSHDDILLAGPSRLGPDPG